MALKRVMQPSSCPICHMSNRGSNKFTTLMKSWEDLTRVEFQCGFCGSIFWWREATREACGLENPGYPLTRAGWNTDIKHIDPKYEAGDQCPRCNADANYREDKFWGVDRKCAVCDGRGFLTEEDV